jgi:hypothetical protein
MGSSSPCCFAGIQAAHSAALSGGRFVEADGWKARITVDCLLKDKVCGSFRYETLACEGDLIYQRRDADRLRVPHRASRRALPAGVHPADLQRLQALCRRCAGTAGTKAPLPPSPPRRRQPQPRPPRPDDCPRGAGAGAGTAAASPRPRE